MNLILRTVIDFANLTQLLICQSQGLQRLDGLIDNSKLGLKRENKVFICENLILYKQCLARICRELKRAKKYIIPGQIKELLNLEEQ